MLLDGRGVTAQAQSTHFVEQFLSFSAASICSEGMVAYLAKALVSSYSKNFMPSFV